MAPIPGTRRPARRRTLTDLLIGLLATAALLALTAGVPLALVAVFGLPVPHSVPSLSVLTHQLDVFSILRVLSVAVWLAWLQLVCCVIAEVRAAVRNAGMPARVPLAGGTQALVHRLVTAALLTFAATAALSPALTQQAGRRPSTRRSRLARPPLRVPRPARPSAATRPARRPWPTRRCWPARRSWRIRRSGRTPGTARTRTLERTGRGPRTHRTRITHRTEPARCEPRRSMWCSRRPAGFTRACGKSRRSFWATAAGTGRSSS